MKTWYHRMALSIALSILALPALAAPGKAANPQPQPAPAAQSAWDSQFWKGMDPQVYQAITPLDRKILQSITLDQYSALLNGANPRDIRLSTGKSLADLIKQVKAASTDLVFTSVTPCRVVDTRNAGGIFSAGETRGFVLRGPATDYSPQGGNAAGCGIPGLSGTTVLSNTALAVAINIIAVGPLGPGDFRAWPSNQSIPNASVINYANVAGLNIANGVIVPMCDEASATPCASGDISFRAEVSGTHLVIDITGYFHAPAASITSVTAGTGLAGGGSSGDVTLSLDTAFRLPQSCANGQLPAWNSVSNTWGCVDASAGDITGVTTGTGLSGGGTTGDVSVSIDTPYRLPQICADGQVARWNNATTQWDCSNDLVNAGDITGVAAGTGLAGGGTDGDVSVSLATSYQLPQTCDDGQVAKWSSTLSQWECVTVGGIGFTKADIYENVNSAMVAAGAGNTVTNTASCNDANDIPLEGTCRPVPSGADDVVIASEQALNWSSTTLAAQFRCVFKNEGASQVNTQTRILCVTVP